MAINQLYTVLNSVSKQALGDKAVEVTSTASMVSLGNEVLSSASNKDKWVGVMMDRIGRTIVSARVWNDPQRDPLVKKPFEYGSALQKLYIDLIDAGVNNSWNIGANDYTPAFAPIYKPNASQKIFNKINTWEFPITVPDHILRTAFTSAESMSAWIDGIFVAMQNSLMLALRNANNLTRATGAAIALQAGNKQGINLLAEYKAINTSATVTAATCLTDKDFLRYAVKRISEITGYMSEMSRVFNSEGFARHTPADLLALDVLTAFDGSITAFLQSDTFHDQLVKLPNFRRVNFWQGSGADENAYSESEVGQIDVTIEDPANAANTLTVKVAKVLAIAYDLEALGSTIDNRRMTSERNNHDEYTDYYQKANIGYFADPSENLVVFYAADAPTISFSNPTRTVAASANVTNAATVAPAGNSITYASSDTDVATVNSSGKVTGVAAGTCTISATTVYQGVKVVASYVMTVTAS